VRAKDIALSIAKARKALDDGDPILAKTILTNLSHVATEPRIAPLLAEARAPKFAPVRTAQDIYERYKWLTPVWPEAKAAFEKLAASPDAGVFARLAQKELARPVDSHVWSHYCESLYARVGAWRKDERSKYTLIRTATLKGGNWPRLVAAKELRAAGILNNDFAMTWRPLVRISKLDMIEDIPRMPTWRYHARLRDAEPLAPGWAADFDDAAWKQAPGPLSRDAKAPLTVPRGAHWQYVRIAFNLGTTELTTLKLLYTNPRRRANAVAYLNGQPVAFLDEAPAEYRSVDLSPAALKLLRKGRNVLAVRSSGQEFDIGLYAQPKGGRP